MPFHTSFRVCAFADLLDQQRRRALLRQVLQRDHWPEGQERYFLTYFLSSHSIVRFIHLR
jgi:hypothetical protein